MPSPPQPLWRLLLATLLVLHAVPAQSSEVPNALARGDEALAQIDYPSAVRAYEMALHVQSSDARVLWRLARVHVLMSEVEEGAPRDTLLQTAEQYARRALRSDSTVAEGYTWLAAALGYRALWAKPVDQLSLANELLHALDAALIRNPNDDVALSIKGSFYRALGNVSWIKKGLAALFIGRVPEGGFEESEEALRRAVAIAPEVMRHRYELAVLYLDTDRVLEAVSLLEEAATMPVRIASDRPRLETIHELLMKYRPEVAGGMRNGD